MYRYGALTAFLGVVLTVFSKSRMRMGGAFLSCLMFALMDTGGGK
jgi:hypothetical protein